MRMPFYSRLMLLIVFSISLSLCLPSCAKKDQEVKTNDDLTEINHSHNPSEIDNSSNVNNASKSPEFNVIELYADPAKEHFLEGVWESHCEADPVFSGYSIKRRIYHLNGYFRETALYNDSRCETKNSRNTVRYFGILTLTESLRLFNGIEDIELHKITSSVMTVQTIGFPIPLNNLTLDNFVPLNDRVEVVIVIENRLYVTNDFSDETFTLIDEKSRYLTNNSININGKSNDDIDQLAIDLLNPG